MKTSSVMLLALLALGMSAPAHAASQNLTPGATSPLAIGTTTPFGIDDGILFQGGNHLIRFKLPDGASIKATVTEPVPPVRIRLFPVGQSGNIVEEVTGLQMLTAGPLTAGDYQLSIQTFSPAPPPPNTTATVTGNIMVTPVPAALPLLGTALAGLGTIGWRRNRAA